MALPKPKQNNIKQAQKLTQMRAIPIPKPKPISKPATGLGFTQKQGGYLTDPGLWKKGEGFSGVVGDIPTLAQRHGIGGYPGPEGGYIGSPGDDGGFGRQPGGRWVTPDYSGILGSFTADKRARFGAGQAAKQASRLSAAKALVNRLGTKDVGKMVQTLMGFGFDADTAQATAQGAFDNPWSETKATEFTANRAWQGGLANRAARGGFRSGGTVGLREDIDLDRARQEAMLAQGTLEGLSGGLQEQTEWERQERDQMEDAIAQQQASLAAAYQPYWQTEY